MGRNQDRKERKLKKREMFLLVPEFTNNISYDPQTIKQEKADNWLDRLFHWLAYSAIYKYRAPGKDINQNKFNTSRPIKKKNLKQKYKHFDKTDKLM